MTPHTDGFTVRRIAALGAAVLMAIGLAAGVFSPTAAALPGQCWNSPFGGYCDTAPLSDGSFQHCLTFGGSSFCTQACHNPLTNQAEPTDMDMRTLC